MYHAFRSERVNSELPNRTALIVSFVHLPKCAGTTIREMFSRERTWLLLPYCVPSTTANTRGRLRDPGAQWIFHDTSDA